MKNQLLTSEDLIEAGYAPGPSFKLMFEKIAEYETRGITDKKYALKLLKRDFAPPPPKAVMRDRPVPCQEAIRPETKEEKANVAAVRRKMDELLKTPVIVQGAIMPDACPAGPAKANIPVGGAIAVENAIIPSAHSADICCSMFATFYKARTSVAKELDALTGSTRFGPGHRHLDDLVHDPVLDEEVWSNRFLTGLKDRAHAHLADQGDGNHFAFLGEVEVTNAMLAMLRLTRHDDLASRLEVGSYRVLVTHHGSRGLGAHVYKRGQAVALKHVERKAQHIPPAAAWIDARSPEGGDYWEALQYVARWTKVNHQLIHRRFLERIGGKAAADFGNEHNFVWQRGDLFFHGKGATPAWKDSDGRPQLGLIPLNMAEPILMVLGADQEDFLSFAPHGAGRNLSRTALRRQFPDEASRRQAIEKGTDGIDVRWFCGQPDLGETPVAYKNADSVKAQIDHFGLAEIVAEIAPLGCIMAGDVPKPWLDREKELTPKQKRQIQHRKERRRTRQRLQDDWS